MSSVTVVKINKLKSTFKNVVKSDQVKKRDLFEYRTLNLGSYKMFFTVENNELVYKFI